MVVRVLVSLVALAAIACGPGTSRGSQAEPAIDPDIAIVAFGEPINTQPRAPLFRSIECRDPMALEFPSADPIAPPWVLAGSGPQHASAAGLRVAIVDVGFDGYQDQLRLRLPERVEIRSFRADGLFETGTDHGAEAAAIVHAVAPEAELTLVVVGGVQDLRLVAEFLVERRITLVSSSIGFVHAGAGDGTGPASDALSPALEVGTIWINGVGNWGLQHWRGPFCDSDADGVHEFAPAAESNGRSYRTGDGIIVSLRWDEPWGSACVDFDLELFRPHGALIGAARGEQSCSGVPLEQISATATEDGVYQARVTLTGGNPPSTLDLYMLGTPNRGESLTTIVSSWSLAQPADHPGVIAVGAWDGASTDRLAGYSSRGPTSDGRAKPDVALELTPQCRAAAALEGASARAPCLAGHGAAALTQFPDLASNPSSLLEAIAQNWDDKSLDGESR